MSASARGVLTFGAVVGLLSGLFLSWGPALDNIRDPNGLRLFLIFLVLQIPYLALLLSVYKRADRTATALAAGIGVVSLGFGIFLFAASLAAGMLGGGIKAREYLAMISLFPGAVILAVGAIIAFFQSNTKGTTFGAIAGSCFGIFLLYLGAWGSWSNPPAPKPSDYLQEEPVYRTYNHIHACNQLYAKENPDKGFAASLDQLGPAGINCLTRDEVSGPIGNRKLKYEPGAPRDSRIASYHIATMDPGFYKDDRHIETDESGVIFFKSKDGIISQSQYAAASDMSRYLYMVSDCLQERFQQTGSFPHDLDGLKGLVTQKCRLSNYYFAVVDKNTIQTRHPAYRITYSPVPDASNKQFLDFTLSARPLHYGEDGIRSYVMSKNQVVHGTPQNRLPELSDPIKPPIE